MAVCNDGMQRATSLFCLNVRVIGRVNAVSASVCVCSRMLFRRSLLLRDTHDGLEGRRERGGRLCPFVCLKLAPALAAKGNISPSSATLDKSFFFASAVSAMVHMRRRMEMGGDLWRGIGQWEGTTLVTYSLFACATNSGRGQHRVRTQVPPRVLCTGLALLGPSLKGPRDVEAQVRTPVLAADFTQHAST